MKYQFCIRFDNIDKNSSASKAVLDCNRIFHDHGYKDYTLTVGDNSNKKKYYALLSREVLRLLFGMKRGSLVGIQYPLLSINNVFKYFIRIAKLKGVKFFCVVHDLESLRTGGTDKGLIAQEVNNLNRYDILIVHNERMREWMAAMGVTTKMKLLDLFDYLQSGKQNTLERNPDLPFVYAGNLSKSTFIYDLHKTATRFNLYGPGVDEDRLKQAGQDIKWLGQFSPEEVPSRLDGSFGLIWDGADINECDRILGNYLKYNNPHKCSLYIAAGMPVIAPAGSAVGEFILHHGIGLVVDSLYDLGKIDVNTAQYAAMASNVDQLRKKVIAGQYFSNAIDKIETDLKFSDAS